MLKLNSLNGKNLDRKKLRVCEIKKGRFKEESHFELCLGKELIVIAHGSYFKGRGNYKPWIELNYSNKLLKKSAIGHLIGILCDLLPPGGHIMVIYLNDKETMQGLELGIPPVLTPLGLELFKAGCTSFKDWYFAEGLREGNMKLQGEKPLTKAQGKKDLDKINKEINEFLKTENNNEFFKNARKRARNFTQ